MQSDSLSDNCYHSALENNRSNCTMNKLEDFVLQIKTAPEKTVFKDVINVIDQYYDYTPTAFSNGAADEKVMNAAGENEGSCKLFSFVKIHQLNETQTLHCFGHYYRDDVLQHPENSDHTNIRAFIKHGWAHVIFTGNALSTKNQPQD